VLFNTRPYFVVYSVPHAHEIPARQGRESELFTSALPGWSIVDSFSRLPVTAQLRPNDLLTNKTVDSPYANPCGAGFATSPMA